MNMKKVYRRIAKEHGVTVAEVKRNIQEAINTAYVKPNLYAQCIPHKGEVPTIEEFIIYANTRMGTINRH